MMRLARLLLAVVASACLLIGINASSASATDDRCLLPGALGESATCLHVDGDSLYVRDIVPGVYIGQNGQATGHWQIFDQFGTRDSGSDQTYYKPETSWEVYGSPIPMNTNYAPGQICAIFWETYIPGQWDNRGMICVDIRT
jgi:hypothetical protein